MTGHKRRDRTGPWNREFMANGFYIDSFSELFHATKFGPMRQLNLTDALNDVELAIVKMMLPTVDHH